MTNNKRLCILGIALSITLIAVGCYFCIGAIYYIADHKATPGALILFVVGVRQISAACILIAAMINRL